MATERRSRKYSEFIRTTTAFADGKEQRISIADEQMCRVHAEPHQADIKEAASTMW